MKKLIKYSLYRVILKVCQIRRKVIRDINRNNHFTCFAHTKKKLVTRLPNFPDRMIRYGSFFSKYIVKKNLEFFNFLKVRVGVILFIPRTVSKHKVQLLPSKVCAILHLLNKEVANPHPLK